MEYTITYTATRNGTVKELLREQLQLSATIIKHAKYGGIRKNGEPVTVRAAVNAGDVLTVTVPDATSHIPPIELPLSILYEDDDMLAVNKPCGMPMHPCRGNRQPTLANVVAAHRTELVFRAVGRLDRDTSGVVLLAKHPLAAYRLADAMKRGEIEKIYTAILSCAPTPPIGRIDAPIARVSEGDMRRAVCEGGKGALTEYETLAVHADGTATVRVRLITGRTHQIRVHMAHIGCPLLYDALYGTPKEGRTLSLHATALTFPHPTRGERMTITAPIPFPTDTGTHV